MRRDTIRVRDSAVKFLNVVVILVFLLLAILEDVSVILEVDGWDMVGNAGHVDV